MALVYTNATRTESAVEVTLHILYFVGVSIVIQVFYQYDPYYTRFIILLNLQPKHCWRATRYSILRG